MSSDFGPVPSGNLSIESQSGWMQHVYALYAGMATTIPLDAKSGLGGKLFFGGEIHPAREMLIAANIAGAASLAASADPAAVRQAMRDGVVDFVVTSLEEALRILKNEIRKRLPVAVGVSISSETLTEQMLERGVLADLLPARESLGITGLDMSDANVFFGQGAKALSLPQAHDGRFVTWAVEREWMRWLPRLDACAKTVIPIENAVRQRWLLLAPRYLGRQAQKTHGLWMNAEEAQRFRVSALEMMRSEGADVSPRIEG